MSTLHGRAAGGSRYLYEPFDAASARVETLEQVNDERWRAMERRLGLIERALDRMERRIWAAVYGMAGLVVAEMIYAAFTQAAQ